MRVMRIFECLLLVTLSIVSFSGVAVGSGLVVNIDNPQVREVVAGVPDFSVRKDSTDSETLRSPQSSGRVAPPAELHGNI